jgi:hypothetical protein
VTVTRWRASGIDTSTVGNDYKIVSPSGARDWCS